LEDERFDDEDFRRVWLPDDRVLEPDLLRDAGGEDVRVAMLMRVGECPTSLTLHTPVVGLRSGRPRPRPLRPAHLE
jgi:hypothetical protein